MGRSVSANPKITIIGSGTFGNYAANILVKSYPHYHITLIAVNDYAYNLMATHRLITGGFKPKDITRPLSEIISSKVNIVLVKEVVEFNEKNTRLITSNDAEETIDHDILILATGSKWANPIAAQNFGSSVDSMTEYLHNEIEKFKDAKKILIAGLGFVGVELAGELGYAFKAQLASGEKEIVCVHSFENVIDNRYSESIRNSIKQYLKNMNIKMVFKEKAVYDPETNPRQVKLTHSTIEDIDLFYSCTGPIANLPSNTLTGLEVDKKGYIKVKKTLQTLKYPNIFAFGDINNVPGKRFVYREEHGEVLRKNVELVVVGASHGFKEYVTKPRPVGVSIGPELGVGQAPLGKLGTVKVPEFLIVKKKSKHLFTDKLDEVLGKV
ncbi:hypothetical protein DASC09_021750 [Saccharomycopsis crataegensis]|uniref:FAD/NAD(P)-binding domain-containing protein n=1 Tax=Saccharomycopsis crataegensis TaxID=43959 RepID=A0AAV5QKG0_9ASCO|nr:hypothetical protein DASC09_021750 [Saccharomycopsis crataegensis]